MPRDVNTKIVVYTQINLPSTKSDVTWLILQDAKTRTSLNDATKRFLALIAASASS
jgi:hypothetical protein